jgi:hypothetical protein
MFKVTYLRGEKKDAENTEYYPVMTYHLTFGLDKAADHVYKITNTPKETLPESDLSIVNAVNFAGPNLSEGDIVEVKDLRRLNNNYKYFRRFNNDWKIVEKPLINKEHKSYAH